MTVLDVTRDGAVATLWLDRAAQRNAMGQAFFAELPLRVDELAHDHGIRVVVLAARGPDFSVGLDLKGGLGEGFTSALQGGLAAERQQLYQLILELQRGFRALAGLCKPTIAAVQGWCIGGGVDLICACDIRHATRGTRVSVRETRMAIIADLGSLQRLPAIVGQGHARELALTGRDVEAEEAQRMGLFNAVHADTDAMMQAVATQAQVIAANPPLTVQGVKQVMARQQASVDDPWLDYVALWNASHLASEDLMEAMMAFAQKRAPEFKGR
ncbi:MAG: crotonase/enoyl-CoA hydratase family protein [Pseudomonadota bacterium]